LRWEILVIYFYSQRHFRRRDSSLMLAELRMIRILANVRHPRRCGAFRRIDFQIDFQRMSAIYEELFTFCRMDRKLQCDLSSTRQHLVYLLVCRRQMRRLSPSDRVRDEPPCIHTLYIVQNSLEFSHECSKPSLSSARAPNRRLAWARAAPFRPTSTAESLKFRILYDPLSLLFSNSQGNNDNEFQ